MQKQFYRLSAAFLYVVSLGVAIACVAGFFKGCWLFDLCSQFRFAYLFLLPLCAGLLAISRRKVLLSICLIAFAVNAAPVFGLLLPRNCGTPQANGAKVTILNFNTEFQHNNDYASFLELLAQRSPDIITLVEVDEAWIKNIAEGMRPYPYRKIALGGGGIAVFSKYPLHSIEVRRFGNTRHPRILGEVDTGSVKFKFLAVHPPTPQNNASFLERNEELSVIGQEIGADGPRMVIGDFNCGPWSPEFGNLLLVGLCDSEQGFGPQPSWPARVGRVLPYLPIPPLIPIDHILVSKQIRVVQRQIGPAIHSDHLPVYVQLLVTR
jgi:endonuclease/exonuclease/phosphatase (EEP) superfamily protein YafD